MKQTIKLGKTELRRIITESVKNVLKEAESGGWVVDEFEAEDAYNLAAEHFGNEYLNEQIVRCMGNYELSKCLAFLFRQWDFQEWKNKH